MRKFLIAAAMLCLPFAAQAQVVTKAPPVPGYPSKCGLFYGINAEGSAAQVSGVTSGTYAVGGDIGGVVGYACQVGGIPWFAEFLADFQNLNAGTNGFSLSGPAHLGQRVGIELPYLQFLPSSFIGAIPVPVLPVGVTPNGPTQSYVFAAIYEDDISTQFGLATGHAWMVYGVFGPGVLIPVKLTNNWNAVIDAYAGVQITSSDICLGAPVGKVCPALGTGFRTGVSMKF